MNSPFSLQDKVILVTGASSGIGRATAIECSKMGGSIIISGRNEERLNDTFNQLEGGGHQKIIGDLSDESVIQLIVDSIPNLDGIVHSAGINTIQPFPFISKNSLDAIMNVNFTAPTLLSQKIVKSKKINKNASIIFISSISGVLCSAVGTSMYSATKGAINGVVKGMALDLASKGIRVNCINPGVVETDIFSKGPLSQEQLQEEMKKYPLKRYGDPVEIAYSAIYLLSDTSKWVTGINLVIDGGYTLQ